MSNELRKALDKQKKVRLLVAAGTSALISGAEKLGSAILEDSTTLFAKIPGILFDYSKVQAYSGSVRQVGGFFNTIEGLTGKSFPKAQQRTIDFFSDFVGTSPKDSALLLSAVFGAGLVGRTISENSEWLPINDMAGILAEVIPNIPFDHTSIVIGCLAVTAVVSCKVVFGLRNMAKSSSFEFKREKAREVISSLEASAKSSGYGDAALVEAFNKASDKFNKKFDEEKKLRTDTLDEMKSMRAAGAAESDIEKFISGSADEYRWVKKIYSSLIEDHCFAAPLAAKVAHDLIILHDGDLPLLQRRLHSAEVPQEMAIAHGFNPRSIVGELKIKDRPSELLKVGKESLSSTVDTFLAATDRIRIFYSEKKGSEEHAKIKVKSDGPTL